MIKKLLFILKITTGKQKEVIKYKVIPNVNLKIFILLKTALKLMVHYIKGKEWEHMVKLPLGQQCFQKLKDGPSVPAGFQGHIR